MRAAIAMEIVMGSDSDSISDDSSTEDDDLIADLAEEYMLARFPRYLTRPGIYQRQTINTQSVNSMQSCE